MPGPELPPPIPLFLAGWFPIAVLAGSPFSVLFSAWVADSCVVRPDLSTGVRTCKRRLPMSHANGDHQKQKIDREHHSVNGNEGSRPGVSGYGYRVVQPRQRHYARSPGGLIL